MPDDFERLVAFGMKKAGTIAGSGLVLAGCPDKSEVSK